jgi:hypothetical protein
MTGRGIAATAAAVAMLVFAPSAIAGTVTTPLDNGTSGSLRNQIQAGGTVTIAPGVNPIVLNNPIVVTDDVTITGQGAGATTIAADIGDNDRIRLLNIGPDDETPPFVTLANVTVRNFRGGDGADGPGAGGNGSDGGAIRFFRGSLEIRDSVFIANRAGIGGDADAGFDGGDGGSGGSIAASDNTNLTIRRSTFTSDAGRGGNGLNGGNGGGGGAIFTTGNLVIENSRFHDCKGGDGGQAELPAGPAGNGGSGGALQLAGDAVTSISGTNFEGNRPGHGGGVPLPGLGSGTGDVSGGGGAIHSTGASMQLVNSTIQLNGGAEGSIRNAQGGGVLVEDSADSISFATIAYNGALFGGRVDDGPGIFATGTGGSAVLRNSILSTNYPADLTPGLNCEGAVTGGPGTANVSFPPGSGCTGFSSGDPKLLIDIVNPDGTLPLQAGSSAVDTAPAGSCTFGGQPLGSDQLGRPRPSGIACDLGASELQQAPFPPPLQPAKKKCKKPKKKTKKAMKKFKKCKKKAKKKK